MRIYLFYLIVDVISKGVRISVCQNKLLTDVSSASRNKGYVEFNQRRQHPNIYKETTINHTDVTTEVENIVCKGHFRKSLSLNQFPVHGLNQLCDITEVRGRGV